MPVHLVFCSCPDSDTAQRLAAALVEARLAACVSLLPPMRSVYRWQGAIEQADEVLLLAPDGEDDAALLARLIGAGLKVRAFQPTRLTLDDAYLAEVTR